MAQAYSDYGVLDGKKETRHEKASDSTATEHRVKMSASPMKRGLFGRFRKGIFDLFFVFLKMVFPIILNHICMTELWLVVSL